MMMAGKKDPVPAINGTVYDGTGALAYYTVPAGVTLLQVKVWGASGGGRTSSGTWGGGGGGFSGGNIPVTPGETLTLAVGVGGHGVSGDGAGGWSTTLNQCKGVSTGGGAGGGGASGTWRGTTPLLIAGGGGGEDDGATSMPGAGGGLTGQASGPIPGGTQSSGGNGASTVGGGSGGGYFRGGTTGYNGGAGGSGFVAGSVLLGQTITGDGMTPGNSGDTERGSAGQGPLQGLGTAGRIIIRPFV